VVQPEELYLSVLVLGEIRHGIELLRRRDTLQAEKLEKWLLMVIDTAGARILPIDVAVSDCWGRLGVPNPVSVIDGLLAATALHYNLILVTRNTKDMKDTGVKLLNPFENE